MKLGFVLAPARTRLARKQNTGLLVGRPSFADNASRTCLPAGRAAASQKWKIIYLQVLSGKPVSALRATTYDIRVNA